jgi:two-component system, LytTR family, response regulator
MKLRTVIVDDEAHARENLSFLIRQYCPELELVGAAADVLSAESLAAQVSPELVFLDISMPAGIEGFHLLDRLREKDLQVVFVTAFREYAQQALEANAIEYLLKPVDAEDLVRTVKRVIKTRQILDESPQQYHTYQRSLENLASAMIRSERHPEITVSHPLGYTIVDPSAIMYVATDGLHTSIVFRNGNVCTDVRPISVYDEVLDKRRFFRIHKSHIINLSCLKKITATDAPCVIMENDIMLPVARQRMRELASLFSKS